MKRRRPTYAEKLQEGLDEIRFYGGLPGSPPPNEPRTEEHLRPSPPIEPVRTVSCSVPTDDDVRAAEAREMWSVVKMAQPTSAAQQYTAHQNALRALENEKLNRLQIMKWAQETRARFLRLSMTDRRLFLEVLTADENGAFTRLFALQAELEAAGVTDEHLKLLDVVNNTEKLDGQIKGVKKEMRRQKQLRTARAKLQSPSAGELPPLSPKLCLPGAKT